MTETSGFARVRAHETPDELVVEVSGDAPDAQSHDLRLIVEQHVATSAKPLVLDLTGLTSWEHEAQAFFLHLVREQRARGRSAEIIRLQGTAETQAYAAGMRAYFRSPPGSDSLDEATPEPATTPARPRPAHARRPGASSTCQYGHPAGASGTRCEQGHLLLPL
ncbi:STAS domain-containing protein [Motilibacter deserti]|uniref:STAS domain-containing protein n=1 Tax=Motilibacter deserti TaxID=2714956 RepID=A0ABX0H038_9ACTN|nr:STAS domain-containing protein [Motilibacter deserti]NHC14823.1 hypothetical protein [Motilibacter deserti]